MKKHLLMVGLVLGMVTIFSGCARMGAPGYANSYYAPDYTYAIDDRGYAYSDNYYYAPANYSYTLDGGYAYTNTNYPSAYSYNDGYNYYYY